MLGAALAAGGVRPRKVDKKVEKAAVAVEKQALLAKLRTPGIQGPDLLALVIPYLVAKLHGKLVRATLKAKNRFVDGMLSAFTLLIAAEVYASCSCWLGSPSALLGRERLTVQLTCR